jgi:hypothetical protein
LIFFQASDIWNHTLWPFWGASQNHSSKRAMQSWRWTPDTLCVLCYHQFLDYETCVFIFHQSYKMSTIWLYDIFNSKIDFGKVQWLMPTISATRTAKIGMIVVQDQYWQSYWDPMSINKPFMVKCVPVIQVT